MVLCFYFICDSVFAPLRVEWLHRALTYARWSLTRTIYTRSQPVFEVLP